MASQQRIAIIGAGYVGLVSAACFAELGHYVIAVDNDAAKLAQLRQGKSPIFEPGLETMLTQWQRADRLRFTNAMQEALAVADMVFLAVGTPSGEDGKADLRHLFTAAEEVLTAITKPVVLVTKSTVPVGTGAKLKNMAEQAGKTSLVSVASNPEFLREGCAIDDFMHPDRIVIGVDSADSGHRLSDLYRPLTNRGFKLLQTDIETAEMIKYAANSFLATKIAFINEMADICEKVGANVELVAKGMGMDTRIGERFLRPGPGFGGSCFPKDALALAQLAREHAVEPKLVDAVVTYNLARRDSMGERVIAACGGVKGKTIAILGLTFKANTDDMRESVALRLIPQLLKEGAHIRAFDPQGMAHAKPLLPAAIHYADSASEVMAGADTCVIVTEWQEFAALTPSAFQSLISKRVVDLRNLFEPAAMQAAGIEYHSIGRKTVRPN